MAADLDRAAPDLPLAGVRVVDISSFLAAPMASMFLADYGADVIKVERPGKGDEVRYWGHNKDGVGLYFKVLNRSKKSVTADLHTPLGVEIVKRLAANADLIVENYRPGTLEKWGSATTCSAPSIRVSCCCASAVSAKPAPTGPSPVSVPWPRAMPATPTSTAIPTGRRCYRVSDSPTRRRG